MSGAAKFEPRKTQVQGAMTWALVKALTVLPAATSFGALRTEMAQRLQWLQPFVLGGAPHERPFGNAALEEAIETQVRLHIELAPIAAAVDLLARLLER